MKTAPSILSADFLHLEKDIRMVNSVADFIHLDIMDGTLVPNISFGFSVIDAVKDIAEIPMDAHLMVVEPQRWFDRLAADKVGWISFHLEASGRRTSGFISTLHGLGVKAGIAINPDIPVEKLFPYIGKADYFVIMSVFAGFGGQKFIYESLDKVARLKEELEKKGDKALIEVDGGVNETLAKPLAEAGADILVAGSSVFKSQTPESVIKAISKA